MFESDFIPVLCSLILGGTPEARVDYMLHDGPHHVRVDCLTETHAVEIGLDARRSSYDSLHQTIFAADLTGREPMVVLIDTDGAEDNAQFQVETVARRTGAEFRVVDRDLLLRLQMTAWLRDRRKP